MREEVPVRRRGWPGQNMWIAIAGSDCWDFFGCLDSDNIKSQWIAMETVDYKFVPWTASHADMLAEDWEIAP
jgi:hypothetical protein